MACMVIGNPGPRCVPYCIVLAVGGPGHALLLLVKGGTVATCDPSSLNTGAHKFFMIWMGFKKFKSDKTNVGSI